MMSRRLFLSTLAMLASLCILSESYGQTPLIGGGDQRGAAMLNSNGIVPASCASCSTPGTLHESTPGIFRCRSCGGSGCALCDAGCGGCGENGCVPGRGPCETCEGQCQAGRLFCAFKNAICCPDPCYEPRWVDGANASFFVDSARPWTMTRLRWDAGRGMLGADRAEYFMAAAGAGGRGFAAADNTAKYDEVSLYQEFANGSFSFFIDTRLRSFRGDINSGSGFGDMILGTKTMFIDSELVTMTMQMRTILPTGLTGSGVGTGHVTIEPSLLSTLKLCSETYLQTSLGLSAPLGGNTAVAGTVIQYRGSMNHVLARPMTDTALIGTFEMAGLSFTNGQVTLPNGTRQSAVGTAISVGPGMRLAICNRVDAGLGVLFNVTSTRLEDNLFRTELRWRY